MGVTEGDFQVYRCRRDPGKLYNNFCYTYLTKDQPPPSSLVVCSIIQCSCCCILHIDNCTKSFYSKIVWSIGYKGGCVTIIVGRNSKWKGNGKKFHVTS